MKCKPRPLTPDEFEDFEDADRGFCVLCEERVQVGEVVVRFELPTVTFEDPTVFLHVACMAVIVDQAPEQSVLPLDPEAAMAKLRSDVLADLDAFNEVTAGTTYEWTVIADIANAPAEAVRAPLRRARMT